MNAPTNFMQQLAQAEKTFVASVTKTLLIQQEILTRDEAQAGLSFTLSGTWNQLERVTFSLPQRLKK